jgi:hypothetical protein
MQHARTLAALAALMTLMLGTTGCLKVKQTMTLMPDGSGKVEMTMGFSEAMLAMMPPDQDPFAELSVAALSEDPSGFVAFTEPEISEADGYKMATFTAYFEDVNELEMDGPDGQPVFYALEETDAGTVLTVSTSAVRGMMQQMEMQGGAEQLQDPQAKEMIAGMEVSETFIVPGTVTDAGGIDTDGNSVSLAVDADMLIDGKAPESYTEGDDAGLTITFTPGDVDEDAVAAFQAEMEAAKATYEELLEAAQN